LGACKGLGGGRGGEAESCCPTFNIPLSQSLESNPDEASSRRLHLLRHTDFSHLLESYSGQRLDRSPCGTFTLPLQNLAPNSEDSGCRAETVAGKGRRAASPHTQPGIGGDRVTLHLPPPVGQALGNESRRRRDCESLRVTVGRYEGPGRGRGCFRVFPFFLPAAAVAALSVAA
jgi:hypothetical protein